MRRSAVVVLLLVAVATVRAAAADASLVDYWKLNHRGHNENTNRAYDAYPNHTLVCYDHVLRDVTSVDAHRLHIEGREFAASFRFPVSHLEYDEVALLEVRSIVLDEISDDNCSDAQRERGDAFRLAWSEYVGWPHWAQLPMPCGTSGEQRFGVSMHSHTDWGTQPRQVATGHVYRAHSGRESPDAVVQRLNKEHRDAPGRLQSFVLTAYMQSRIPIGVRALHVRKCLVEPPHPRALEAMRSSEGARRQGVDPVLAAQLQAVPVALTPDEVAPRLLPLRSCVWEESSSGSCFVDLGWVNAHGITIDAADCHHGNCLQPAVVDERTYMPQHFAPGWHRNHTRVAWTCQGWRPGKWHTLRWTLGNGIVQIDHTTPICHDVDMPYADNDAELLPPIERYRVQDYDLVTHEQHTTQEYWQLAHGQDVHTYMTLDDILRAACAINQNNCEKEDDSDETFQALLVVVIIILIGVVIVIVIFVVSLILDFPLSPIKLLYIVAIIIIIGVGLVGFNFLFAPRLNRPSGVQRPGTLFDLAGISDTPLSDYTPASGLPSAPDAPAVNLPDPKIPSGTFGGINPG